MKKMYLWIICSCLIFGTGVLCDRNLKRRQACSENTDDEFNCSDGLCIKWPFVCDGHEDCSDGSDETKELCAIYEFGTNMTMDCGRVHNLKNQVTTEEANQSIAELAPWAVFIQSFKNDSKYADSYFYGTLIAPNIVISAGSHFWNEQIESKQTPINDGRYKIGKMRTTWAEIEQFKNLIDVTMIYLPEEFDGNVRNVNIAVLVLANKVSFSYGFVPICIDWFGKYNLQKQTEIQYIVKKNGKNVVLQGLYPLINNETCTNEFNGLVHADIVIYDLACIITIYEQDEVQGTKGSGLSVLYSDTYFLTEILMDWYTKNKTVLNIGFTGVKKNVSWIHGILNKHVAVNSCVLPTVEGVVYSYEGSNEKLFHGTLVDRQVNVTEDCEVGYYKAYPNGFRVCLGKGKWLSSSDKLCFKITCPPLLSDSLVIKCNYNGKYANCSNRSIPDTIATTSCKPNYALPNGQKETPLELHCQSNGKWKNELYSCEASYSAGDVLISDTRLLTVLITATFLITR